MSKILTRLERLLIKIQLKASLKGKKHTDDDTIGILGYAPHKTASMFVYKLFKDLAREKKILFFSDNNSPPNNQELNSAINNSFCLAPIRSIVEVHNGFPNVQRVKKIIQIRDPRDIVVSEYFSLAFSHPDDTWSDKKKRAREIIRQMTVDDYVMYSLQSRDENFRLSYYPLLERFQFLPSLASDALVIRYEDMISDFNYWLKLIIDAFEFRASCNLIHQYYFLKYEQEFKVPKVENIYSHKRAVKPGNFRKKLRSETIAQLNEAFLDFLNQYGYDL